MTLPTPDQIRSRQTAYLATEHWWRSRVEALAESWREEAESMETRLGDALVSCANELDALIAERNPR